jgi:hypothetical protein
MKTFVLLSSLILTACTRHVEWQSTITLGNVTAAPTMAQERNALLQVLRSAAFRSNLDAQNSRLWGTISHIEFRTDQVSPTIEVRFSSASREACLEAGQAFADAAIDLAKKKEQEPVSTTMVTLLKAPTIVSEH